VYADLFPSNIKLMKADWASAASGRLPETRKRKDAGGGAAEEEGCSKTRRRQGKGIPENNGDSESSDGL
jgi:hypothetical protein